MNRIPVGVRLLVVAAVAFAVGLGAFGTVQAEEQDENPGDLPPAKAEALADAVEVDPDTISFSTLEALEPTTDVGSVVDVAAVKTVTPLLLQADVAIGRLPLSTVAARVIAVQELVLATLETTVGSIWTGSVAAERAEEWLSSLEVAAADPDYRPYDFNTFSVAEWQGVHVTGNSATVTLLGHDSYHDGSGWQHDEDGQYQLKLKRSGSLLDPYLGWRLESSATIPASDLEAAEE